MSHPPDYPGRRRVKRAAASLAGDAYQGAFEAVMAVLLGCGVGYFVDWRWHTTPYGVLVGVGIGFAAMVLRLLRLGRELQLETDVVAGSDEGTANESPGDRPGAELDADTGPAEMPAQSDVLRDDATGNSTGERDE